MADELTNVLLRFEDAPYLDDVDGLAPLIPAWGSYPSTAVALAAAVGYGTWSGGWLDDDAGPGITAAFGGVNLTALSTPLYQQPGPLGAADFAIGFDSSQDGFSAGNTFNPGTGDFAFFFVGYLKAAQANADVMTKYTGASPEIECRIITGALRIDLDDNAGHSLNLASTALPIGTWFVGGFVIDRGAGVCRVGWRAFDGTSGISATASIAAFGTLTSTAALIFGSATSTGVGSGAPTSLLVSAHYVAAGAGAALNMSANLGTALGNLAAQLTAQKPTSEQGVAGNAAVFAVGAALQAADQTNGATALPRDATVQALVRWDIAAQNASGKSGTLIARGRGDVVAEYMPFGLEFVVIDPVAKTGLFRWIWQTAAGVVKTETGGGFINPTGYMLITATRRWTSPTSVVLRYYIGTQRLCEIASTDGDIASSASGTTFVGGRVSSGAVTNFFCGAIDELRVLNYEMSAEEIDALWYRMSVTEPDGYRQIKALMPPGMPLDYSPGTRARNDLESMGAALGLADGFIENFRNNIMPDRAYGEVARRWESITQQPSGSLDSLDRRRTRVLGHLAARGGVSVPSVQAALADVLNCQPSDLQILAFDATIRDTFAALDPQVWFTPNAGVDVTVNEMRLQLGSGLAARWDVSAPGLGNAISALLPVNCRALRSRGYVRAAAPVTLTRVHVVTLPTNCEAGIVFSSWTSDSRLFFGVQNSGGTQQIVYQRFQNGVAIDSSPVVVALGPFAANIAFRAMYNPSTLVGLGAGQIGISLAWSDNAPPWTEAMFTAHTLDVAFLADFDWIGPYLRTFNASTSGAAADVRITADSAWRDLNSARTFYWYAYRNPALGGSPDFVGAQRIIRRMRHAYTHAAAISSKSLLYDDAGSGYDLGPLGAV